MIYRIDWLFRATLLTITFFLGCIALRPLFNPTEMVLAQSAKFDHVFVVSSGFLYKGSQGLLLMDRRNGNVWFIPRVLDASQNLTFQNPVFLGRVPLETLDQRQ